MGGTIVGPIVAGMSQNYAFWSDHMSIDDYNALKEQGVFEDYAINFGTKIASGNIEGGSSGSSGGVWGALIGAAAGDIMGVLEAAVGGRAMIIDALDNLHMKQELEKELEKLGTLQSNISRELGALVHPLEQQMRTRARIAGQQARSQGLTGAQAIAVQMQAERMYRETIGPALPELMRQAENTAILKRGQILAELETKFNIRLRSDQEAYKQSVETGSAIGSIFGNLKKSIGTLAGNFAGEQDSAPKEDLTAEYKPTDFSDLSITDEE